MGGETGTRDRRGKVWDNFVEESVYSMMLRDYGATAVEGEGENPTQAAGPRSGRLQLSDNRRHLDKWVVRRSWYHGISVWCMNGGSGDFVVCLAWCWVDDDQEGKRRSKGRMETVREKDPKISHRKIGARAIPVGGARPLPLSGQSSSHAAESGRSLSCESGRNFRLPWLFLFDPGASVTIGPAQAPEDLDIQVPPARLPKDDSS